MKQILILEDEQRAGEKLIDYLKEIDASFQIDWRRSIVEGIAYLEENRNIDLIVSDIELLDGPSFEIYKTVEPPCPIIFCTAFDHYYVNAFETKGISYLLKPFSRNQFQDAWKKYESLFATTKNANLDSSTLLQLKELLDKQSNSYKQNFSVKKRDGVFLLKAENIVYFQAQGDFVLAFDNQENKHIINSSLSNVLRSIDPKNFFQINRSEIIQLQYILKYEAYTKNRLAISTLLSEKIYTSNSRASAFKSWVEG